MDIENMHPFCLPFGLCHDATSSSITGGDFSSSVHNNNNNNINNNETYSSNNNIDETSKDKIRSKNSSPTDELFRHLNNATSIPGVTSLLHEDLIIGSSTSLGHDLLGLNIDNENHDDSEFNNNNINEDLDMKGVDDEDDIDDDWFCDQYSLFSPANSIDMIASAHLGSSGGKGRKSLIRQLFSGTASGHNVFQHVVDPIDIKSSPTLAQLNLNSADDPTDNLWDRHSGSGNSGNHNQASSNNNIDLLSNCTSINRNSVIPSSRLNSMHNSAISLANGTTCINNHHSLSTCNHLNSHLHTNHHHHHHHNHDHHHQNTHHTQSGNPPAFVHLSGNHQHQHQHQPTCPHHYQNQINHHHNVLTAHYNTGCCAGSQHVCASATQHQCPAVAPFRKPDQHNQQYSSQQHCCHHHNSLLATTALGGNGPNLRTSATLNQLNQQMNHNLSNSSNLTSSATSTIQANSDTSKQPQQAEKQHKLGTSQQTQARSASPALVTSSSSPGSLNAANKSSTSTNVQTATTTNENRLIDNKLKENIEYLTALLCNGNNNKLDSVNSNNIQQQQQQQQQPQSNISSTMVRSYATLAHSLSTGPKLLERHSQVATTIGAHSNAQQRPMITPASTDLAQKNALQANTRLPVNEALPCANSLPISTNDQSLLNLQPGAAAQNSMKRQLGSDGQWYKYAVESSVSAADSTESQISSMSHQHGLPMTTLTNQPCQQAGMGAHQGGCDPMRQKTPEMKVLSSLLSANKCLPQQLQSNLMPHSSWPQAGQQVIDQTNRAKDHPATGDQQATNIPVNGKPITLTPISTSNGILAQQLKPRSSLFAQPASPSASSTDSSGCISNHLATTTTTASSSDSSSVASNNSGSNKRMRASGPPASGQKARSGRPNSLSTDCSLSSHDEGFASQIDNEDCTSMRDSDDEDDIDSDDESFYGDYTNSDLIGASISDNAENKWTLNMGRTRRNGQKRYFWQYNVQSKGPKGTRICSADDSEDPFVLPEASDPVFSNDCQIEGVKHSGKARRGDGNDLTPNPRKLLMIGLELKKLGKIINDLAPVTDLPLNARNKTRKEKNKLASRACRLKKKAQHEANKIKLYGLQREHQQVVMAIYDIRKLLNETLLNKKTKEELEGTSGGIQAMKQLQQQAAATEANDNNNGDTNVDSSAKLIAEQCSMKVAGQTSNYVNSVLEKVVSGCIDGGLQT